jgi:cysteinyl-tRNA synthetase
MLKVYNTLTRAKEPFQPLDPPKVRFYNCGPTVYGYFHIGNARNFILADTIRRYLRFRGYEVRLVQNITDIDDKIIRRANEEGVSTAEVAEKYTRAYLEHVRALGIEPADLNPRATGHIPQMVAFIQKLIDKGFAYESQGDVYFSVSKFPDYGKLSRKNIAELREGERVAVDPRKRDPKDFDLWKAAKPGEPAWDSPWGPGRPGWHVECSVMSGTHLGETIDIHSGGSDLQFPHHENEIAQSEAVNGKPFVRYWIHNAFLNISGQKMSKSLGNFVTIDQVLARFDPMAVRYFFLTAHYRSPMDYTADSLAEATSALARLSDGVITVEKVVDLLGSAGSGAGSAGSGTGWQPVPAEPAARLAEEDQKRLDLMRQQFTEFMDDDFNTPRALSVLFDAVTELHEHRRRFEKLQNAAAYGSFVRTMLAQVRELAAVLGLQLPPRDWGLANRPIEGLLSIMSAAAKKLREGGAEELFNRLVDRMQAAGYRFEDSSDSSREPQWAAANRGPSDEEKRQLLETAIAVRNDARAAKRFEIGDFIRNSLGELGIILEDYRSGTIWKRDEKRGAGSR